MSQDPTSKLLSWGGDFVPTIHHDTYSAIDPKQFDFSGKAVLITGASKGIGRKAAASFAKAGCSTIVLGARSGLDEVKEEALSAAKAAGRPAPTVLTLNLDISSQESVEAAAAKVANEVPALDVLINNAAYLATWERVVDSDPADWWKTWQINVLGTYLMCRSFLPLVLRSQLKTIVNVTSGGAHRALPTASAYQTTKLAVCRFTEFLMSEHGDDGLIAFNLHPGGVRTETALRMPEHMMSFIKDTPELGADAYVAFTAERRPWVAGRYLNVTWDWEEFLSKKDEIVKGDLLKVRMDVGGRS